MFLKAFLIYVYSSIALANINCMTGMSAPSGINDADVVWVSCPIDYQLVSCGFKPTLEGSQDFRGSWIDATASPHKCYATNTVSAQGVYAVARCCNFTQEVNCVSGDGPEAIVDDELGQASCTTYPTFPFMLGCSATTAFNAFDGTFFGVQQPNINISSYGPSNPYPPSNICTVQASGQATKANINCCSASIGLQCNIYYAPPGINNTLTCPDHQSMISCSAWNVWKTANTWYVDNSNNCITRSKDPVPVYTSAICCNELTASPTLNYTIDPTMNPTPDPTPEPTTCYLHNEGWSAFSNDGLEQPTITLINALFFNYTDFGILPAQALPVNNIAEYATKSIDMRDDELQYLRCGHIVSCLQSPITITNNSICSILCIGLLSCGSANINIDSCTNIHITCFDAQACDSTNITITNASHSKIDINCGASYACDNMKIDIIGNTTSTNITCIDIYACNNIEINVDDAEHTLLFLYEYSENVIFDNKAGFLSFDRTIQYVQCNTKYKYIKYNDSLTANDVETIVLFEYLDTKFPCAGVTIKCLSNLNDIVSNASCAMDYNADTSYLAYLQGLPLGGCYWISVEDLIETYCLGTCVSSPTEDPTAAPTTAPTGVTIDPSTAPSSSPTGTPTAVPTSPTIPPTKFPTNAPTDDPTISPSWSPTQPPSINPSPAPTIPPSASPTSSPTYGPTQAPTRNPTSSKKDFDSMIIIIYKLINLNDENNNFILNNTLSHAIQYIQEVIESHYYSTKFLNSYEDFTIQISKVNDINPKKPDQFIADNVLKNDFGVARNDMVFDSKIEFEYEHANYILATSKDTEWYAAVTNTFREYFNNSMVEFYVDSPDELEVIRDEEESSFGFTFWTLNAMLFLCVIAGVISMVYNKISPGAGWKMFRAVDESDWLSIILYGVQIYDIVSDLNLTFEIFVAISEEKAHVPDEDREGIVDTPKEWILFLSGWFSVICTVLPYSLNIWAATQIPKLTNKIVCARTYFQTYRMIFIFLVIFSGGAYPALTLVSSNLFGLEILNSGLSRFEINSLVKIRVVTTVVTENVPQLAVQIMYSYAIGDISQNTVLAFCTSVASIIASVMIYCMNKEQQNDTLPVDYYLQVKKIRNCVDDTNDINNKYEDYNNNNIHETGVMLSNEEKENILMNRGVTYSLAKKMTSLYGDIDMANYQIAYVHLRNDNFVIRIVQQAHIEDLHLDEEEFEMKNDTDIKKHFGTHCVSEYSKHKREITSVIFDHYGIDENLFQIMYHQKYPISSSSSLYKSNDGIEEETEIELIEMGNKKEGYNLLTEYRKDILKGIDIIKQETNNLPKTKGVTSLQINRFIQTLSDHNMNHRVIEDVLSVAVKSGTLKQRERKGSDIDGSSDDEIQDYVTMEQKGEGE